MVCHVPGGEYVGLVGVAGGLVVFGFGKFVAGGVDWLYIFGATEAIAVWCYSDDGPWFALLVAIV